MTGRNWVEWERFFSSTFALERTGREQLRDFFHMLGWNGCPVSAVYNLSTG